MGVEREGMTRLQASEIRVLRKVTGFSRLDCIRNEEVTTEINSGRCEGEKREVAD